MNGLMTLVQVRQLFIEMTGRTDLVESTLTYANKSNGLGADFFIQAGQRFLDQQTDTKQTLASVDVLLSEGEYEIVFPHVRAVNAVGVLDSDGVFKSLELVTMPNLRERFSDLTDLTNGQPDRWARNIPDTISSSLTARATYAESLYILPPPDEDFTITLLVRTYQASLKQDNDISWWSLYHPDLLLYSAAYKLEAFYRNRQGMEDWQAAMLPVLRQINYDFDEELASGDSLEMENSW